MRPTLSARDRVLERTAYQKLASSLTEENINAYVAAGKAMNVLTAQEKVGTCSLEKASVYGAAVAIPQIARSAGWPRSLTAFAVRSYFFLVLNIVLQTFFLTMLAEDSAIMSPFAGKMHLCDLGAKMERCPEGPNCDGPGGTKFSAPRLYGYDIWSTRVYVRDSLLATFPHLKDRIEEKVDPGEYGIENYHCRLVCCFLFMMAMMQDLLPTLGLMTLLYSVPTGSGKWLRYEPPGWAPKERVKNIHGWTELDLVKFGVASMPCCWKVVNFIFIFIPKLFIWWKLALLGTGFLMNTEGIVDEIMNSMALTFILNIDEMIFATLTTEAVKHMMTNLEDYDLFDLGRTEEDQDSAVLVDYVQGELGCNRLRQCGRFIFPKRLFIIVVLLTAFEMSYYFESCDRREDGSWVSKPLVAPTVVRFDPRFFFTQSVPKESEPFWSMPP